MKKRNHIVLGGTATALVTALSVVPAMSAGDNPFQANEIQRPTSGQQRLAQGMCGGSWQGSCGGMMRSMPPGIGPAELPEPDSAGAKLLTEYCTQCHALPSPKQHSASGWPSTVGRMNMRMQWMSRNNSSMSIKAPTEEELRILTTYLEKHAMTPGTMSGSHERQAPGSAPARKPAIEILQERYARGDIDRKEYLQRLEDLKK